MEEITVIYIFIFVALYLMGRRYLSSFKITNFESKVVLITGCDTGFGNQVAKRLDGMGFKVIATCLTENGAQKLKDESSKKLVTIVMDITSEKSINDGFEIIKKECPQGLWAVINNAGLYYDWIAEATSNSMVNKLFNVNVIGLISVCKLSIPLLRETKGRIINVSSVAGRFACFGVSVYSATKYAVQGFSDSLRRELGVWGIKVIIIEPGIMKTNLYDTSLNDQIFEKTFNELPLETQETFGKEFFQLTRKMTLGIVNIIAGDPSRVVDGMVTAVTAKYPFTRYAIGRDKYFWLFLSYIPTFISDFIFSLMGIGVSSKLKARKSKTN